MQSFECRRPQMNAISRSYHFERISNPVAFRAFSVKPCVGVSSWHPQQVFSLKSSTVSSWKERHAPSNAVMPCELRVRSGLVDDIATKCHHAASLWSNKSCFWRSRSTSIIRASQEDPSENSEYSSSSITVPKVTHSWEARIDQAIFDFRFLTLFAVIGSLTGSIICFLKGSALVLECFKDYFGNFRHHLGAGQAIMLLVEAIDVYLMGTVMLILGMGLHDLFVGTLSIPGQKGSSSDTRKRLHFSSLFGLFPLTERPRWLRVESLAELKQTLGHAIVMILLVGMFEKSKKVPINSGLDLLCFSTSILLTSGCLFLLSKLH